MKILICIVGIISIKSSVICGQNVNSGGGKHGSALRLNFLFDKLSEIRPSNISIEVEDQLAKQIYEMIEHFKQQDPIGLPLVPLPDPIVFAFQ